MPTSLRFKFTKTGPFKYLSHLDIIGIIIRAMRRAGIKAEYSKGFNPKPKIVFSTPIPLGMESDAEYADVRIAGDITAEDFCSKMNQKLEGRITVSCAREIPEGVKSIMSQVDIAEYLIGIDSNGSVMTGTLLKEVMEETEAGDSVYGSSLDGSGREILLYGFTKTAKGRNDRVFKLKPFLEGLEAALESRKMKITGVMKKELFVLKHDKKLTPFEVLQFYV